MTRKLNVAVIGCGIGANHIRSGYALNPDRFHVAAVCDLDEARARKVADELGVPRVTTSFDEMLADPGIDIIDICTPPFLHFEQTMAALKAGKHVIVEKPHTSSVAEVDIVEREQARTGRKVMPIFQIRYGDGAQKAKRLIGAGIAGRLLVASAETLWTRDSEYYAVQWRGKWASELGGVLMAHAIHVHDLLFYLIGTPSKLFGRVATRVNPIETDDCASASVLMADGALVSLTACLGSQEQISRLRIAYENITFESNHDPYTPSMDPWRIIARNSEVQGQIDVCLADWTPVVYGLGTQFARFHDALVSGDEPPVTLADARLAAGIVTAFYHSAENGVDVALPITPDHPKYANLRPTRMLPGVWR
jgi:predicted dehydrogenase